MYSPNDLCYNDNSCDCFFITDVCNHHVTCEYDARFSSLTGYNSLTDPEIRDLTKIIHPDDLEKYRSVKEALSSENPFESIDLRLIKKDGTLIYVTCNLIYNVTDDNYERIVCAFSVLGDSDFFRQQEEMLRGMHSLVFKFRRTDKFPFYYNDSFLKLIACTREEISELNLSYTDFMNSLDVDHFLHAIRCSDKSDTFSSCTVRVTDKNKNIKWVSCSFKKMVSSCGSEYFMGIGEDITDLKKTELDLTKNRMLLNNITENLSCALLSLDRTETHAALIRANKGFFRLFGYTEEDMEKFSQNISELIIHPDDHSRFISGIMRSGNERSGICRAVTATGKVIWVSCDSFTTLENSKPCYMCTFHDVTALKETENELTTTKAVLTMAAARNSDVYCTIDFEKRTLTFPEYFSRKYGIPEIIENMPDELFRTRRIHESFHEAISSLYYSIRNGKRNGSSIFKYVPETESPIWLRADLSAIESVNESPSKAIAIISDISEQMTSEEYLESMIGDASENERMVFLVNLSQSRIVICRNPCGTIMSLSGQTYHDSLLMNIIISHVFPADRKMISENLTLKNLWKNYFEGKTSYSLDFRINTETQEPKCEKLEVKYFSEDVSSDIFVTMKITDLGDSTGIEIPEEPTSVHPPVMVPKDLFRRLVNEYLSVRKNSRKLQALYVLDLNAFSSLQKRHGTDAGQKILDTVSKGLLAVKRPSIAGKSYGDEFLIFIKDISDYDDLNITAKELCSICNNLETPDSDHETVTGCVGVAYSPAHGCDFESLYRKAEAALSNAKRFDKTRYAIYSEENASDRRQLILYDFKEKASKAVKEPGVVYHLYNADIKEFRNINHILGYEKGDKMLKEICSMLQEFLKPGEYFTRLFADNFLILTQVHDTFAVMRRMEEINYRLQKLNILDENEIKFSAGYVQIDDSNRSTEFEQLIDCSITAHEHAKKKKGSVHIRFEPSMYSEEFHKYEILSEIQNACRTGQICTFVQPQYDILNHEYVSMEALVRWNHPVRGLLTPDKFIDVCEENGFISDIDFCVLEQMCSYIRRRLDADLRVLPIAINQSQITIHEKGYVRRLMALTGKYNIPPKYIELEVTESAYVNNLDETISVLSELRECGFRISMDDFGTGYSTLNFLKDIPVDSLKIDKTFLTENLIEKKPAEIIKSITNMAHNINIRVVCEGVEFPQQVQFLQNIGCELVQGYLFGKPMPYTDVADFIENSCPAV
ncbi:EAL domain-containing protein [Ruminococcus sp. HUN007]|uniref:EAL domain-containing protein n=1 Tax=Ruminococcus sp. HUN007 TaxID=1514668 RepID=UPI0005D2A1ED|nr:EAL domain-containing protein [Ruminococcus sp. HUN007]